MKIVVVSDTHMPRMNKRLPSRLIHELTNANMIIHAGDWTKISVYTELAAYAPTYGVAGNNDGEEIVRKFGFSKLIEHHGFKIGIVHGHGAGKRTATEAQARDAFKGIKLDALIYGHSHIPIMKRMDGMLIFNPGSPTDKRRQPLYSFGIIQIAEGALKARHVFYNDKS